MDTDSAYIAFSAENFEDLINFYTKLMKNSDKMHTEIKKYLNEDIFKKFQVGTPSCKLVRNFQEERNGLCS